MKSFKDFLIEYTVNRQLTFYKGFKVLFVQKRGEEDTHSLESRLERAGLEYNSFLDKVKKGIDKIKDSGKNITSEVYYLKYSNFKLLVRVEKRDKKNLFKIITILTPNMNAKDYDVNYIMEFFNFDKNYDINMIEDKESKCDIIIENDELILLNAKEFFIE